MTTKKLAAAAAALAIAGTGIGVGVSSCGAPHPVKPAGDSDKARDCWAHPDASGRRHCAT